MTFGLRVLCFVLVYSIASNGYSQSKETKLREKIKTSKDSSLINAYLDLAKYYYQTTGSGDSLILYGEKARELSQSLKYVPLEIEALKYKGVGNLVEEQFKDAEKNFNEGITKASNINDIEKKADLHNKLGTLYQNQNKYLKAVQHFLDAAKYAHKIDDYKSEANSYYGISLVYTAQLDYKKQLDYIIKAVNVIETYDVKDELLETLIYNYAAEQYMEASKNNKYSEHINSAKLYAELALTIAEKNNFDYTKPISFSVLSEYYFINKNYDKTIFYSNEVLKRKDLITEPLILNTYCLLGRVNTLLNNKNVAIAYIDSLHLLKIKSDAYYGIEISNYTYEVYKHFNNSSLALKALEKKEQLVKEQNDKERNKTITDIETKYKTELKDAEIKSLNQQQKIDALELDKKQAQINKLIVFTILIMLILISILFITKMVQLKRTRQKNYELKLAFEKQIQLEKELSDVRDDIAQDFHDDLGNKLARISLLSNLISSEASIDNPKVKSKIKQITEDANGLYRGTRDFIFSLKSNSDCIEEVATYLSDFGEDFFEKTKVKFIVKKDIATNVKLPHYWNKHLIYIFKEALTNTLKHSKCDFVTLSFIYKNKQLTIISKDNGIGMSEERMVSSNGLSNMKKRAIKIGGLLNIYSEINKGTTITFMGNTNNK